MSVISFSGLVTGLDTNSWVSALTALKNAKVTELQEEKAAIEGLKDVVSNVKSYFSAFRSSLERLTDAKFGVDSLDIFVQNLANSSNPGKVTATATSSASRDTYEIGVTQLATATKVNTAIRNTITVTYTADETTKLSILGVQSGYVSVNNHEIQIENRDTIGSLIEKLSDIGVTAYYEEDVGRFTIATDIYEVDAGSTDLFSALGIEFKTVSGVQTGILMTEGYVTIKPDTLLADIGANGGQIMINKALQTLNFDSSATVQTFLDYMNTNYGVGCATMDANGIITIQGVDIEEINGGSNIITALGLTETVDSVTSTTEELTFDHSDAATWSTELGKLNNSFSDYQLILGNGTDTTTVNLSANSTLNDVKSQIETYATANGMTADVQIDSDGVITIGGDIEDLYIFGGIATGLGLEMSRVNGTEFTSSSLSFILTTTATTSTTFKDLEISAANLTYNVLNERKEVIQSNTFVTEDTTLEQWFDSMKQYGITGSISEEGVISIDGGIISGNLAAALGMGSVVSGQVVAETKVVSKALAGTTTTTATMTSNLKSLGVSGNQTLTVSGSTTKTFTFSTTDTLQTVANAIASCGGTMTVQDGALNVEGVTKLSGSLLSALGIEEQTIDGTSMYNANMSYSITSVATSATKLSQLGCSGASLSFAVYDTTGNLKGNVTMAASSDVGALITQLRTYDITAKIDSTGVMTLENGYIEGGLATQLGLSHVATSTFVSKNTIISNALVGTVTTTVTATSTLEDLGITTDKTLFIQQGGVITSLTFSKTATLDDIMNSVKGVGGSATFENKKLEISGVDNISGTLTTALGLASSETGNATSIYSNGVNYTVGSIATSASRFVDFGVDVSGKTFDVYAPNGELIVAGLSLSADSTVTDLTSILSSYGLSGYLDSSGAISIANGYITGDLATALGFTNAAYETVVAEVTQVSGGLSITVQTIATMSTSLGSLGISGTTYLTVNHDGTTTEFTFANIATIADVSAAVISAGGTFNITDGYISVTGVALEGDLLTGLGLNHNGGSISTYETTSTEIITTTIHTIPTRIEQVITTITTTLTTTESISYVSGQNKYDVESPNFDPNTTKLSQLGVSAGTVNLYNGSMNTTETIFTVTANSTVSDLISALKQNGIDAKYADSRISLNAEGNNKIQNGTSNLVTQLGFQENIHSETLQRNSTSTTFSNLQIKSLDATSTIGEFATSADERVVNIVANGRNISQTFESSATVQDVIDFFAANGITVTVSSGVVQISASYQEISISGSLGNKLLGNDPQITQNSRTTEWSANINDRTAAATINGNAKLVSLGVTTGDIKIYDNGTYIPTAINISDSTTIDDLISSLQSYGFSASLESGKLKISAGSEKYLLDETSNIVAQLGLTNSFEYNTIFESTTSPELTHVVMGTITKATTLYDLGFVEGSEIRLNIDGNVYSIGFSANESMQDVLDALAVYDIESDIVNGTFTATSTIHEFSLAGDLGNVLWPASSVVSTITTVTGYTSDLADSVNAVVINEDAKLVDLGIREGALKIYDNGTWINTAINIKSDTTIGDFLVSLENYGFTATLDGGKITISADSDKYIADETTNLVAKLQLGTKQVTNVDIYDQTTSNTLTMDRTYTTSATTTLKDLGFDTGASLRLEVGGVVQTIGFTADETVQDIINALATHGIDAEINNGVLTATSTTQTFSMLGTLADVLTGAAPTYVTTEAVTGFQSAELTEDITSFANADTKLTTLGVSTGYINLLRNGEILATVAVREETTIGQFFSAINAYGINGTIDANGVVTIESTGDMTLLDGTCDLVSVLGLDDNIYSNSYKGTTLVLEENVDVATTETLVTYYDTVDKKAVGAVYFSLYDQDGEVRNEVINIDAGDTIGVLVEKLNAIGLQAEFKNGQLSYHYGLGEAVITGGESVFAETLGFADADLEQWMQSTDRIEYAQDEIKYYSVCNYAGDTTTLETLGVSDGEFSLGVDGSMYRIGVSSTDTIANVISRISAETGGAVTASLNAEGKFCMEAAEGVELIVGTATDTTNLVTIFNLEQYGTHEINGLTSLYKVSSGTKLTESGAFRLGDVTEGTFIIGNETFTITENSTIASLINEINHSEKANANAYWDNINGKMIITSASLGSAYVSIEGGTSNFTEIFGLTITEDGEEKLTTYNQELGNNAILSINGTRIVSTSNTITSDISRIEGLTVNIKDITRGDTVTITVERDTQSIVDAVKKTLEDYNGLIKTLNEELSIGGDLHSDTTLKSIRKQLQSLMTSKAPLGSNQFRNLSGVGISTEDASSAMPTDIYSLFLDEEKFERSLNISEDDVKSLLVGTDAAPGILTSVENIIENMLSTSGYFKTKTSSLDRQIKNYDKKIERAQAQSQSYKELLERRFQSMEMVYSNMQSGYQNLFAG